MSEIFSVSADEVGLGNGYTKGMRNLQLNGGASTWSWNGRTYDIR